LIKKTKYEKREVKAAKKARGSKEIAKEEGAGERTQAQSSEFCPSRGKSSPPGETSSERISEAGVGS